jgi:hypothetical protein
VIARVVLATAAGVTIVAIAVGMVLVPVLR